MHITPVSSWVPGIIVVLIYFIGMIIADRIFNKLFAVPSVTQLPTRYKRNADAITLMNMFWFITLPIYCILLMCCVVFKKTEPIAINKVVSVATITELISITDKNSVVWVLENDTIYTWREKENKWGALIPEPPEFK